MLRKILLCVVILLLIQPVHGIEYQVDFSLSMNSVKMCPGNTVQIIGTLKNTGSLDDSYKITSKNEWITIAPQEVFLGDGTEEKIYIYLTPYYKELPDNHEISIQVKSNKISQKEKISLDLLNCQGVELNIFPSSVSTCPEQNVSFEVEVENIGKNNDVYDLISEVGKLGKSLVELESGETETIILEVPFSEEDILVIAKSKNFLYVQDEIKGKIFLKSVQACYGFELDIDQDILLSEDYKGHLFTLNVKNIGEVSSKYNVISEGPEWIHVDPEFLEIESNEEKQVYVYASPPFGEENGEYDINIKIESDRGIEKSENLKIVLSVGKESKKISEISKKTYKILTVVIISSLLIISIIFKEEIVGNIKKFKKKDKKKRKTKKKKLKKDLKKIKDSI